MTIIKKKSMIVALVSSVIISLVLVLTLIGYVVYIEIKEKEFERSYQILLEKVNARVYSKHIVISKLDVKIETSGVLKGKPVIEGIATNNGTKHVTDMLLKVKFLDRDGAVIYEIVFHPQEPSLGSSGIGQMAISYIYSPARIILKADDSMPFKKILANCPKEILFNLQGDRNYARSAGRWSGKLSFEILSIDF